MKRAQKEKLVEQREGGGVGKTIQNTAKAQGFLMCEKEEKYKGNGRCGALRKNKSRYNMGEKNIAKKIRKNEGETSWEGRSKGNAKKTKKISVRSSERKVAVWIFLKKLEARSRGGGKDRGGSGRGRFFTIC